MQVNMASLNSFYLGFLLIVLCLSHGSARKIISDHVLLHESKLQVSEPILSPKGVSVSELVKEADHDSLEVALESSPPSNLDDAEVDCHHPACRPRAVIPKCPSPKCAPAYKPRPKPDCKPAAPPQPEPFNPPQPAPFYPPQPEPLNPPQPAPHFTYTNPKH
ncbi:hypothetical protein Tco_0780455 [Tanacetum coccineum]